MKTEKDCALSFAQLEKGDGYRNRAGGITRRNRSFNPSKVQPHHIQIREGRVADDRRRRGLEILLSKR